MPEREQGSKDLKVKKGRRRMGKEQEKRKWGGKGKEEKGGRRRKNMLADRLWGNCDWSMQMTMPREHVPGNEKCALELEEIGRHFPPPIVSLS